jgi:hypothetical protein
MSPRSSTRPSSRPGRLRQNGAVAGHAFAGAVNRLQAGTRRRAGHRLAAEEAQVPGRRHQVPVAAAGLRVGAAPVAGAQHQAAAGLEHTRGLGQQRHGVGHMLDHVPQRDDVEVRRRQRGLLQRAGEDVQAQPVARVGRRPVGQFHALHLVEGLGFGQEETGGAAHVQQPPLRGQPRRHWRNSISLRRAEARRAASWPT